MRVLGIDPGIATCGYGVVDQPGAGREAVLVACGALRPPGAGSARLVALFEGIRQLIVAYGPEASAVERLYHNRNVRTAADVGQARGVILLALAQAQVAVAEYTPTEVKLSVAGFGGAGKAQVKAMVAARLHLTSPPRPDDAADALGLCLCHLQGEGLRRTVLAAESRAR